MKSNKAQGKGSIVVVGFGEVNTGGFTPQVPALRALCDSYDGWLHIDGGMFHLSHFPGCERGRLGQKSTNRSTTSSPPASLFPSLPSLASSPSHRLIFLSAFGVFAALLPELRYCSEDLKLADSITADGSSSPAFFPPFSSSPSSSFSSHRS